MESAVYQDTTKMLKALSDPKRLRIVDLLSRGEQCAYRLLEEFSVTQPTLSHDMKVLTEAGIVKSRKEGKNTYYTLCSKTLTNLLETMAELFREKEEPED